MVIVPAGGQGRRLNAVSTTRQKVTLPFFGRSVLESALQPCLDLWGDRCKICIVTEHFHEQVEAVIKCQRRNVTSVRASAVAATVAKVVGELLIIPGDTIMDGDGLRRFLQAARRFPAAVLVRDFGDFKGRQRRYPLPKRKFVFVECTSGPASMAKSLVMYPDESYDQSTTVLAGGVLCLGPAVRPRVFHADPHSLLQELVAGGAPVTCIPQHGFFCDLDDYGDWRELQLRSYALFAQRVKGRQIHPCARVMKDVVVTGALEVEEGAVIESNVRLIGPVHIGAGTVIQSGAFIQHSWIGRRCRIGPNTCVRYASIGNGSAVDQGRDLCVVALDGVRILGPGSFSGFVGAGTVVCPNAVVGDHPVDNQPVRTTCGDEILSTGFGSLGVLVGDGAVIGPNAKLMPGRHVGAGAQVDSAVVAIRNVPPHTRVRRFPPAT